MSSPSPSSSSRPSPLPRSPLFTSIPELNKEEEVNDREPGQEPQSPAVRSKESRQLSVLFNKCRPSSRDTNKSTTAVVPLDSSSHVSSPSNLLHSLLNVTLTLTRRSPRQAPSSTPSPLGPTGANEWKLEAQELSRKLLESSRQRDEALLESSRLKRSVSELERKLDRLESCCLDLKRSLDRALVGPTKTGPGPHDALRSAVVEARIAVQNLTRALWLQIKPGQIIQNREPRLIYIESLLSRLFFDDFEKPTAIEDRVIDPAVRFKINRTEYETVKMLTWEEVLSKGTRFYSEGLSKFCDKKMGEIVRLMGWAKAWPESLLKAFFWAAKGVWIVYVLARCGHREVRIMRVERGVGYDGKYMEDVSIGRGKVPGWVSVRMMVAPGFYLDEGGRGLIKSKVVCGCSDGE